MKKLTEWNPEPFSKAAVQVQNQRPANCQIQCFCTITKNRAPVVSQQTHEEHGKSTQTGPDL